MQLEQRFLYASRSLIQPALTRLLPTLADLRLYIWLRYPTPFGTFKKTAVLLQLRSTNLSTRLSQERTRKLLISSYWTAEIDPHCATVGTPHSILLLFLNIYHQDPLPFLRIQVERCARPRSTVLGKRLARNEEIRHREFLAPEISLSFYLYPALCSLLLLRGSSPCFLCRSSRPLWKNFKFLTRRSQKRRRVLKTINFRQPTSLVLLTFFFSLCVVFTSEFSLCFASMSIELQVLDKALTGKTEGMVNNGFSAADDSLLPLSCSLSVVLIREYSPCFPGLRRPL
jgi:hypothetical protein